MTWILAQPNPLGQVLALSDIQVMFEDTKGNKFYKDCLQKMYQIDNSMIVGFAGNVYGGLTMISKLLNAIDKLKEGKKNVVVEPEAIISNWAEIAKKLFPQLENEVQSGGIHLLLAGVSHSKDLGIPGVGKPFVAILKSPDFTPQYAQIGEWISIGLGTEVNEYKKILEKLSGEQIYPMMQMEVNNPGGFALTLGIILITDIQKEAEVKGISKHFHVAIVSREGVRGGNSDHTENLGEEAETHITMPDIAHNLTEFEKYVEKEFGRPISAQAIKVI